MMHPSRSLLLTTVALCFSSSLSVPINNAATTPSLLTIPLRRQTQPSLVSLSFAQTESSGSTDGGGQTYDAAVANQQVQVVTALQTGNDQTFPSMLVDTGSAFLWVNAGQTKYSPGTHSQATNMTFSVSYGGGSAAGEVYVDQVSIGAATVQEQYIGAAENVTSFTQLINIDGILGLGRDVGNNNSISGKQVTPTFVDSLYNEGTISQRVVGIYLTPYNGNGTQNDGGEITFGGMDKSKISGDVVYVPQQMDNRHWAVLIDEVKYGDTVVQNASAEAIVDTGTLPILLPFNAFFGLRTLLNGTILSSSPLAGWLSLPPSIPLSPLIFTIGGSDLSLPPEAYLMPESLYGHYNVTGADGRVTWFASGGYGNAALGQKFLELFYSVYDSDNERVGFAPVA